MPDGLAVPNGRAEIEQTFGVLPWHPIDGSIFVRIDPAWEQENLVSVFVDRFVIRMHKKLSSPFVEALMAARQVASQYGIHQLGGYCPRQMKTLDPAKQATAPLSVHSWGAAFDVNWDHNPFGATLVTDLPPEFVAEFTNRGWDWGGAWHSKKDPMHFQYAVGY